MPRILTVVYGLGPGGTERNAQNYAIIYKSVGYMSAVLSYDEGGMREEMLRDAGIEIFVGSQDREMQMQAIEKAVAWYPDVVHIHRSGWSDKTSGHVVQYLRQRLGPSVPILETNVFGRVDYSPAGRLIDVHAHLSYWCLWRWNRWKQMMHPMPLGVIIPYAVDTSVFYRATAEERRAFRALHKIPDNAIVFGRIGQPSVWKWSPIIIKAFERVALCNEQVHLLLVGWPPEWQVILENLPINIRRRIHQVQHLHGDALLRVAYSAFDIFLHASQIGETFGMVLAEAMLCECPVITLSTPTRDNSQLELVGHNIGGLVVVDQASMEMAMKMLADNRDLRNQFGRNGRLRIFQNYSMSIIASLLTRIITILIQKSPNTSLGTRIKNSSYIASCVKSDVIESLMTNTMGKISWCTRILMMLVHHPLIYRIWMRFKFQS